MRASAPIIAATIILGASYSAILWTSLKIRNHVKDAVGMSGKTRNLHKQLTKTLVLQVFSQTFCGGNRRDSNTLFQALSAWLFAFIPILLQLIVCMFPFESGSVFAEYEATTIAWIPVINPAITMFYLKSYRRQLLLLARSVLRYVGCTIHVTVEPTSSSTVAPGVLPRDNPTTNKAVCR